LALLSAFTSDKVKWELGSKQSKAFTMVKPVIAREVMLAYPDFSNSFTIHADASHQQLGGVISQDDKPIVFYNPKLNPAQTRYAAMERELLSIVKTLKEHQNIL
jgi:hypothetical protein